MVGGALGLLSGWVFAGRSGELIPQLDAGDFALNMTLDPGSSLAESIQLTRQAQRILKRKFPDVLQIVGKIGTSQIPTDPLSLEDSDQIIILKDRTVSVLAHLPDTGPDAARVATLLPGQYVSARIITGRTPQRTLSEGAIVPGGEVSYAYYQVKADAKGSTYHRFSLRPGATDQGQVAVRLLDKLTDTTRLVVKGAYFLDAERSKGEGE